MAYIYCSDWVIHLSITILKWIEFGMFNHIVILTDNVSWIFHIYSRITTYQSSTFVYLLMEPRLLFLFFPSYKVLLWNLLKPPFQRFSLGISHAWTYRPLGRSTHDVSSSGFELCREFPVPRRSGVWLVSYIPHDPMTHMLYGIFTNICPTYCGWLRNPAPVENGGKHPIVGFQASQVVQDFFFHSMFQPSYWNDPNWLPSGNLT